MYSLEFAWLHISLGNEKVARNEVKSQPVLVNHKNEKLKFLLFAATFLKEKIKRKTEQRPIKAKYQRLPCKIKAPNAPKALRLSRSSSTLPWARPCHDSGADTEKPAENKFKHLKVRAASQHLMLHSAHSCTADSQGKALCYVRNSISTFAYFKCAKINFEQRIGPSFTNALCNNLAYVLL